MGLFEGSFLGDGSRIGPETMLECGVCWWVYEPGQGDAVWQIPAGTAFQDLPEHWRCPNCDAAPHQFMVLQGDPDDDSGEKSRPRQPAGAGKINTKTAELLRAYSAVAERMRELPVYNHRLDIRVVGMRRCPQGLIAVIATPWCMNLILLAGEDAARREGTTRNIVFPSGAYPFIAGQLDGVGTIETCSLFSPMEQFDDPDVVNEVASHSIEDLFKDPDNSEARLNRRQFLRPGATG